MRYIKYLLIAVLAAVLLASPISADIEKNGKIVIVIDPGHGGVDGGSDKGTVPEKHYNLKLSQYLYEALEESGYFEVHMTRYTDEYLKYLPRVLIAKDAGADLVVSMHCNTVNETWVSGSSAYVSLIEDYAAWDIAELMLDYMGRAVSIPRGKVYTRADTGDSLGVYYWDYEKQWDMPGAWWLGKVSDYYSMITWSSKFGIPSVIIEHGYLSNWSDLAVLDDDASLRAIARAEADALIDYYTGHEHQFGEYEVDYPSNCSMNGTESRRCAICGAKSGIRELAPAPDSHFWRQSGSAVVNCESDGYVSYVCQIAYNLNDKGYSCTVHQYTTTDKALGHDYSVIEDTYPTHDTDGKLHKICKTCGHEVIEVRAGEGHNWELNSETPAQCEADGSLVYKCYVCGEEKTEIIPALGHTYEITTDTEATHTEDGLLERVCATCSNTQREVREAEGHSFGEVVSETLPTCTEEGKREVKCTVCQQVVDEVLAPTGHTEVFAENGKSSSCAVCGVVITAAPVHIYDRPVFYIIILAILLLSGAGITVILLRSKKNKTYVDVMIPATAALDDEDDEDEADEAKEEVQSAEEIPVEYVEEPTEQSTEEPAEEIKE